MVDRKAAPFMIILLTLTLYVVITLFTISTTPVTADQLDGLSEEELAYVMSPQDYSVGNAKMQINLVKLSFIKRGLKNNPINCSDSDGGAVYTQTGFVTLHNYPGGEIRKSDVCTKDGKRLYEYVCENGRYKGDQVVECSTLGADMNCKQGACVRSLSIPVLDYPSLQQIKVDLQQRVIQRNDGTQLTGYDLVGSLLQDYNGDDSIQAKKEYFDTSFQDYNQLLPGEREYFTRIVHSIWLEDSHLVAWSLRDYSAQDIKVLYWVFELHAHGGAPMEESPYPSFRDENERLGNGFLSTDDYMSYLRKDSVYELSLFTRTLIEDNPTRTMDAVLIWLKKNYFHTMEDGIHEEFGFNVYDDNIENQKYLDELGPDWPLPNNLNRLFEERVGGCHEAAFLYADMLRSVNIPALEVTHGHAWTYLPLIDRYVHGDHIADHVAVPVQDYYLTREQVTLMIEFYYPLVANSIEYTTYFRNMYPYSPPENQNAYTMINLYREADNLYLDGMFCTDIPPEQQEILTRELSEYHITHNNCRIESEHIPIQSLEQLSIPR